MNFPRVKTNFKTLRLRSLTKGNFEGRETRRQPSSFGNVVASENVSGNSGDGPDMEVGAIANLENSQGW